MFDEEMGILCHDDNGEFTVAHLAHGSDGLELCLLHHPPPAGAPTGWSLGTLQLPPDNKINLHSWRTDVVAVPTDRCLCWVDYYQGMLLVDVLADTPDQQQPHGIRLPAQALKSRRIYNDAGDPDPFRCVCVTDNGSIKLVYIFVKDLPSPPDFTIITWTLVDIKKGSWTKDMGTIMGADQFFGLYSATQSCLPRVKPTFPVVSLVNPDVICFLLKEEDCKLYRMVEVNMRSMVLQSSALYINEEEEEGPPSEIDFRCRFYGHYFIPTKFSSYLSEDAITSCFLLVAALHILREHLGYIPKHEENIMIVKWLGI
ncbi:hypothetical protein C2845_PM17G14960 [Panicum miliaceum]|uniref:DUF1618 domain-containing protein n=1 Tax=Panicum miliaceum TaxID=4540 RepID=A0A3L6Q2X2_PANMI|nr:hypothetical protein C2845_PM17G14960 [Panicum miliaceum]